MPMLWMSVSVSSSHNSMCDEAIRISCGPSLVPDTYDVVRSSGIGRMTTRALSKLAVVGLVPPNSPGVTWSYSKGRFIQVLEAVGRDPCAVDRHHARAHRAEHRRLAVGGQRRGGGGAGARRGGGGPPGGAP